MLLIVKKVDVDTAFCEFCKLFKLFVGCFTAHQHLGHIGPALGGDKEYIRRGIAISRL
jgi:hypothetical protein